MPKYKNPIYSKKAIMQRFNLSEREFSQQYQSFRTKLQRFNEYAGTNYKPIKEFRYSLLNPKNKTTQAIESFSKRGWQSRVGTPTAEYLGTKYKEIMEVAPSIKSKYEQLQNGEITSKQFNDFAKKELDRFHKKQARDRKDGNVTTGSSEFFNANEVPTALVQENQEFVRDELF